jgi:hypothetical protein
MALEWYDLTALTNSKEFVVSSIKLKESNIEIKGEFEIPPLARLSDEDQVFVAHFIRTNGSIKEMEQAFGVSYPTIKARLSKISSQLQFVEIKPVSKKEEIIAQLERGEISAKEAAEKLRSFHGA